VTPPFGIAGLDHVVLRVRDVSTMRRFYADVLGCGVEKVQDAFGLTQLRAGASLIDLVDVDGPLGRMGGAAPGESARNMDHFCLRVDPWDEPAIIAHLEAAGVPVGEKGTRYGAEGYGPSLYIRDPEGNTVELKGPPTAAR
jgi:glyoxylase I family protein